ncbi:CopG family antitoxin [Pararhizobium sp. O133]|uniref:CopG family antitoxin n=1 Tax=Pararhizobium sp. O133 TaxID=3449278 RepID=UPI003F682618
MMMPKEPKIGSYIDDEEEDLIEAVESMTVRPESMLDAQRREQIEAMAHATMNEEREKISLRIPRSDLTRLKSRALQEGIPYQTLINSIIHKYVSN